MSRPDAAPAADWPLHVKGRLLIFAAGVATVVLFRLLALAPGVVESAYGRGLGPWLVRPMSLFLGLVPFALVEIVLVGYLALLVVRGGRAVRDVVKLGRTPRNALLAGLLVLVRDAGVLLVLFYVLWGFNYARAPLSERLDWPEWAAPEPATVAALAAQAVDAANLAYREIHGSDDAGVPTQMPIDLGALDRALEIGWELAADRLSLPASTARRYGPVKRLLLTPIVARFGVAGFYFPWTGEANVLWDTPAVNRSHSMAHEKAHQRGIGPESEASFLGFIAAANAPHPHARYSAFVFAQRQLVAAVAATDPEAAQELVARRVPGMRRDLADLAEYWARYRGLGTRVGRAVNDQFLRANRVQGGIASYGLSVRLLITFGDQNGDRIAP